MLILPSLEVPLPVNFGLYYEDLELKTSDNVVLKCFLIPQKKDLGVGSAHMEIARGVTEDEVCVSTLYCCHDTLPHISYLLL